jgi:hypothetical protein
MELFPRTIWPFQLWSLFYWIRDCEMVECTWRKTKDGNILKGIHHTKMQTGCHWCPIRLCLERTSSGCQRSWSAMQCCAESEFKPQHWMTVRTERSIRVVRLLCFSHPWEGENKREVGIITFSVVTSRDGCIGTSVGCTLDGIRFSIAVKVFFLLHTVQFGFYLMGGGGSFFALDTAAWKKVISFFQCWGLECAGQ